VLSDIDLANGDSGHLFCGSTLFAGIKGFEKDMNSCLRLTIAFSRRAPVWKLMARAAEALR
jgi:hypothetical protein